MILPEMSIRYRTVVFFIVFVGMIWGFFAFNSTPRREDTEFTIRVCTVITKWPGASAEKVEDLVTDPLEKAIEEIDEVKETESTTTPGQSIIKVTLEDYVRNIDQVWDELRAKLDHTEIASGAGRPYVNSNFTDTTALVFALYQVPLPGEKKITHPYSMRDMEKVCEDICDELKLLKGVAMAVISGAPREVIYLEPDPGALSRLKLTSEDLRQRLMAKNAVTSGGIIDSRDSRFHLVTEGDFNALDEIRRLVAGVSDDNHPVLLKDIDIKVRKGYEDPAELITRYSDKENRKRRCIIVYYTMKTNQNIVEVGNKVKALIPLWEKTIIPPDMKISLVADQPRTVTENISIFTDNLLQSVLILIFVAFLFIGPRVALIMGASIPAIAMISFAVARLFDVKLEKMSITALIISLGMLVDCAIEICDNVHRLQDEGYSRFDAAVTGAKQVAWPILIGTLTTVFAFLPMLFIPGNIGEFIRSIPIVVGTTLVVSWIIALTFTVALTWLILKPGTDKVSPLLRIIYFIERRKSGGENKAQHRLYRRVLRRCIEHPLMVLLAVAAASVFTIMLVYTGQVKTDFIPAADGDQFVVNIWLPEGASLNKTSEVTGKVEDIILEQAEYKDDRGNVKNRLRNMISFIGEGAPRIKLSYMIEYAKSNYAEILVNVASPALADDYLRKVEDECHSRLPDARITAKRPGLGPPVRYPVTVRILGADYNMLKKYAEEVKNIFRQTEGVYNVHDSWGNLGYQLDIIPDQEKCIAAGVNRTAIAQTLNTYYSGNFLTTYREGDHRIPVYLRLPPEQRQEIPCPDTIYVEGLQGKVPLSSVANLEVTRQPSRIERFNKRRNMQVQASIRKGFLANPLIYRNMSKIEEIRKKLPAGYSIEIGGATEKSEEASGHIAKAMLVSLFLIVLTLIVYFNAIQKTVIVMGTLPLALIGAFVGLWITNVSLSFFAQLGLLALFGIVVNGAIVLFDFIGMLIVERRNSNELKAAQGEKSFHGLNKAAFTECVLDGCTMRIRPILMTTFTTIGGLAPLMFNGGPLFRPLAAVIIFGLALSSVLTLFVIPSVYYWFACKFKMKLINEFNEHME
ncbi:MAG: efflux RND transporter permease subunit [Victivallaceae bacterium]|nr:efflux RND transporter permease subunit [Victivallaceae bacterium]